MTAPPPNTAIPNTAIPNTAVPDAAVPDAAVPDAAVRDAITALWQRHRQTSLDRITVLEEAIRAALGGTLDEDSRGAAEQAAHKLAGSLGTFGCPAGSHWSLVAESLLRAAPLDIGRYTDAVSAVRTAVTASDQPVEC